MRFTKLYPENMYNAQKGMQILLMSKIKSAYELACERVIVPKPEMKILNTENDDPDIELPDFVECWKHPDGPQEFQTVVIESDGSNGTVSLIEEYDALKGHKPTVKESREIKPKKIPIREVKVQESYNINYDLSNNPSVHWYGHFTSYAGFSRMNRAFAFGLANRGLRVKLDIQESDVHVNEETEKQIRRMSRTAIADNAPKIFGATIPLNMFHGGRRILYTMMETSGSLHPDYVGKLNLFDEIWVPTRFAQEMFKQNGVHPPVLVMPLGVDVDRYTPDRKDFDFNQELNDFVFLSVFKWGYRKGYDILLKAFMEEFSADDNVTLLLVSRAEAFNDQNQIQKDFAGIRESINKSDDELPHIALYDNEIPERYMPNIYGSADAFVLISRGEGFGLPYAEAGASGMPVIASDCSGHSDFLNDSNAYMVAPDGLVTAETNGHLRKLAKHCRFYEDQTFPNFGRNAIEETKAHMRYVFENYEDSLDKADNLRSDLEEFYTWDQAIDNVYKRIMELNGA